MTPARLRILTAIVDEPGELTAEIIAEEHGLPLNDVRKHLHALTRSRLLEPCRYRLYQHERASVPGRCDTPLARQVLSIVVDSGPLSRSALAQRLQLNTDAPNSLKEALRALDEGGNVAPPEKRFATDKGRRLVEQTREEAA